MSARSYVIFRKDALSVTHVDRSQQALIIRTNSPARKADRASTDLSSCFIGRHLLDVAARYAVLLATWLICTVTGRCFRGEERLIVPRKISRIQNTRSNP